MISESSVKDERTSCSSFSRQCLFDVRRKTAPDSNVAVVSDPAIIKVPAFTAIVPNDYWDRSGWLARVVPPHPFAQRWLGEGMME